MLNPGERKEYLRLWSGRGLTSESPQRNRLIATVVVINEHDNKERSVTWGEGIIDFL